MFSNITREPFSIPINTVTDVIVSSHIEAEKRQTSTDKAVVSKKTNP